MSRRLHITNGDSAVSLMQAAGLEGDILPWRDVLHEGPVPMGLDLEELSRVRADFIADRGWADRETVQRDFAGRDATLRRWRDYHRITLWFEHDLYDQLQILQILDFFSREDGARERLSLICTEHYLGHCTPAELAGLSQYEAGIEQAQIDLAASAWAAFRRPEPLAWQTLLEQGLDALPFLEGAVVRFVNEFPDRRTGLGVTEFRALEMLADGSMPVGGMFAANQDAEERVYLGDLSYRALLDQMIRAEPPLLRYMDGSVPNGRENAHGRIELTATGRALLDGETNYPGPHWPMRWSGGCCQLRNDHWCRTADPPLERIRSPASRVPGPVTLRRARPADAPALRRCAHSAYARYLPDIGKPPGPMLEDYSAAVLAREVHVAASSVGDVLGFIVLEPRAESLLLENVAVDPEFQGHGIGSRLMDLAESRCAEMGLPRISLYTHQAMTDNQVLYSRRGYRETHRVREAGYDRVYMTKPVSTAG